MMGAARRVEKMQDLGAVGGHAMTLDVTDYQGMTAVVQRITGDQGRIDVLAPCVERSNPGNPWASA